MLVLKLILLILWMCFVSAQKIDKDAKDLEKAPKRKGRTLGHIAGEFKNLSNWLKEKDKFDILRKIM